MPSHIESYRGYPVAGYSPDGNFAVITAPGSNAVLNLSDRQPLSTVVEGNICLGRAKTVVDQLIDSS